MPPGSVWALRRRCDMRWDRASAFIILYEGWMVLHAADRFLVFRQAYRFDEEFGRAMLNVLCLRGNPELDELD